MATCSDIATLPDDCVSKILSYTSPPDASRFSMVSLALRLVADSDTLWRNFLPSDCDDIVSRTVNPLKLRSSSSSSSYKHLFYSLCRPLLIDKGKMMFKLDKFSGKKSYILSARELSITWSNEPLYWSWRPTPESRFQEVAQLRTMNWLEIEGKMRTRILTPNTTYAVYLIMNVSHRGYGLDSTPAKVSVEVGNKVQSSSGMAYLWHKETMLHANQREMVGKKIIEEDREISFPSKREDGWMEIEVGEFFCGEVDEEVKMSVMEVSYLLKGGLIVEGMEVRPKLQIL